VDYFTGKALEYEIMTEDETEDTDEEEEDEDVRSTLKPYRL
jgi:hypothetical protein